MRVYSEMMGKNIRGNESLKIGKNGRKSLSHLAAFSLFLGQSLYPKEDTLLETNSFNQNEHCLNGPFASKYDSNNAIN